MVLPIKSERFTLGELSSSRPGRERAVDGDPNAPLCPMLPSVKRHLFNKLDAFLETEPLNNKKRIQ